MIYLYFFVICIFIYTISYIYKFYHINKNQFLLIIKSFVNKNFHPFMKKSVITIILNFILRLIRKIIFKI